MWPENSSLRPSEGVLSSIVLNGIDSNFIIACHVVIGLGSVKDEVLQLACAHRA